MKMKIINKSFAFVVILGLSITSCNDIEHYNETNISEEQLEVIFQHAGSKYKPVFESIYQYSPAWSYQLQQNLNADVYSGYMTPPRPFVSGANNTTYNLIADWNEYIWSVPYENVMNNVKSISDLTERDFPTLNGVALILKVAAMHRVSDVFGPIVYSNFGDLENAGVYDSQEAAYDAFFADLDTAVTNLSADIDYQAFSAFDLSYGGDYKQWVKLANSLRLRLAIRVSKVDPSKAKSEGEKALAQSLGIMTTNADGFFVNGTLDHPLSVIDNGWGDIRMNASMEKLNEAFGSIAITVIVMSDWWEYDPATNSWSQKADYIGNNGNGNYGVIKMTIGNFGYLAGGTLGDQMLEMQKQIMKRELCYLLNSMELVEL